MRVLDHAELDALRDAAAGSPRGRQNLNLHPELDDPVQRFFNALEPGTYVRPHRHPRDDGWELFVILAGRAVGLTFDEAGTVTARAEMGPHAPAWGMEVPGRTWHALAALEPGTLALEVKRGPYTPLTDKDFAPWAPGEEEPGAFLLERWYRRAAPGDRFHRD
jgi:cupin fold WbuC family metalloprotein